MSIFQHLSASFGRTSASCCPKSHFPDFCVSCNFETRQASRTSQTSQTNPSKTCRCHAKPASLRITKSTSSLTRSANMRPDVPERTGPVSSWHRQHILTIHGNTSIPFNTYCILLYTTVSYINFGGTSIYQPGFTREPGFSPAS